MSFIEPNWPSLVWFSLLWGACCIGFLVVAGMFPLSSRSGSARSTGGAVLAVWNSLLLAALVAGTGLYGYSELKWTTLVVFGGLIVLFAPAAFEAWPASWRDGRAGLVLLLAMQILALGLLYAVGGQGLLMLVS